MSCTMFIKNALTASTELSDWDWSLKWLTSVCRRWCGRPSAPRTTTRRPYRQFVFVDNAKQKQQQQNLLSQYRMGASRGASWSRAVRAHGCLDVRWAGLIFGLWSPVSDLWSFQECLRSSSSFRPMAALRSAQMPSRCPTCTRVIWSIHYFFNRNNTTTTTTTSTTPIPLHRCQSSSLQKAIVTSVLVIFDAPNSYGQPLSSVGSTIRLWESLSSMLLLLGLDIHATD